ncbi:MAG: hypothetical protein GY749_45040 [Desulfobacteraceae bacterium]|nr:hypothetical protein [Desulfobacteraceae bacterium]
MGMQKNINRLSILKVARLVLFFIGIMLISCEVTLSSESIKTYLIKDTLWGEREHKISKDMQWMADVNGDGKADSIYNREGKKEYWVMTSKSDGTGFNSDKKWGEREHKVSSDVQWMADVNGDGKADLIYNRDDTKEYWVMTSKSDGTGFNSDKKWGEREHKVSGDVQWMADVNGDRQSDLIYNRDDTKEYWVVTLKSDEDDKWGERQHKVSGDVQWMADVNGDGKADLIYNRDDTKKYQVMTSKLDGTGFNTDILWGEREYKVRGDMQWMTDVNGDGKADLIYNREDTKEYSIMISTETGFYFDTLWGTRRYGVASGGDLQWLADVNNDGKTDLIYNRDDTKEYWVMTSQEKNPSVFTMMITADPQYDWGKPDDLSKKTNEAQIKAMNSLLKNITTWPESVGGGTITKPIGVIINGDLTDYYKKNEKDHYQTWFHKDLNYLIFPGLGNHDYKNNVEEECTCKNYDNHYKGFDCFINGDVLDQNYCAKKAVSYMKNTIEGRDNYYFGGVFVDDYDPESWAYSFNIDGIHFVQLNLNPKYAENDIGIKDSFDWLKKNLQNAYDNNLKSVINMHSYGDTMKQSDKDFLNSIKGKNVIAVFAGHVHDDYGYMNNVPKLEENIPFFRSGAPVSSNNRENTVEKFLLVEFDSSNMRMRMGVIDYTDDNPRFLKNDRGKYLNQYPY